jgi:hypothetical protein
LFVFGARDSVSRAGGGCILSGSERERERESGYSLIEQHQAIM